MSKVSKYIGDFRGSVVSPFPFAASRYPNIGQRGRHCSSCPPCGRGAAHGRIRTLGARVIQIGYRRLACYWCVLRNRTLSFRWYAVLARGSSMCALSSAVEFQHAAQKAIRPTNDPASEEVSHL